MIFPVLLLVSMISQQYVELSQVSSLPIPSPIVEQFMFLSIRGTYVLIVKDKLYYIMKYRSFIFTFWIAKQGSDTSTHLKCNQAEIDPCQYASVFIFVFLLIKIFLALIYLVACC